MNTTEFQELVWQKGRELYRDMPWRDTTDPYFILVSELMLQQTQVDRVIPKFNVFIDQFPTISSLAHATLGDVLVLWSGLGYNRRAKYLHDAAKKVVEHYQGIIPDRLEDLKMLPGIGPNTAAAILNYGFNQPATFVETNIRTVYFHHFFSDVDLVSDAEVLHLVQETIDKEHPREWFWALMDYGSYLKKQGIGRINKSAHYKKQPPLIGSVREIRGQIMKALTVMALDEATLRQCVTYDDRFQVALDSLVKDKLIVRQGQQIYLTK